jgi:hypothetical protein
VSKKTVKTYSVGYGKPPRETQFTRGISGNPRGRPKGSINVSTTLTSLLKETIVVSEGGRKKTITRFEAAITQLIRQALSGNMAAMKQMLGLVTMAEQKAQADQPLEKPLGRAEARMLKSLTKQFQELGKGQEK